MLYIDGWLTAYIAALAALTGAAGGSFVNCLAWRTVHGEKVTRGRSHCTMCGHELGVGDLLPVLGWVLLRGRCRYCGGRISPRYVAVELFMACVSLGLLFRYDVSFQYIYYLGFAFLLLAEGLVDLESYEIPDRFQAASFLWWCLFLPLQTGHMAAYLVDSLAGGFLIGGSLLGISLVFDRMTGRESLGGADIKLFFITGLYFGFAVNLLNLILSCAFGLLLAAVLSALAKRTEQQAEGREFITGPIPFGPAIGLSSIVCMLAGRQITGWYMGLF